VLKQHPIGKLLPAMTDEEYAFVKADIQRRGLRDPILLLDGQVLDGWHRYRICLELRIRPKFRAVGRGADALAEVVSRNLARRQLSPGQRYGVLLRIAAQYPEIQASLDAVKQDARQRQVGGVPLVRQRSSSLIGQMAGVSHATVERVDRLRRLSPDLFDEMIDGRATLTEAIHLAATEARRKRQDALCRPPGLTPEIRVLHGDFRKVLDPAGLPPIALMWADPPWERACLPVWEDVGRLAAKVLRPGGVLAAHPGKVNLPEVIGTLTKYLKFQWPCALLHGDIQPCPQLRVMTKWAPLLLFVKGKFNPPLHLLDVVLTHSKERDRHPWQRPLEEFHHFTKYLTRPGEWVLDPMAGSFVSGRAAVLLGRNYVGVDLDRKAVAKGRAWLEEALSTC